MSYINMPVSVQNGSDTLDIKFLSSIRNAAWFKNFFEERNISFEEVYDKTFKEEYEDFTFGNWGNTEYVLAYTYSDSLIDCIAALAEYHEEHSEEWFVAEYIFEGDWYSRVVEIRDGYLLFYNDRKSLKEHKFTERIPVGVYSKLKMKDMWKYGCKRYDCRPVRYKEAVDLFVKNAVIWGLYKDGSRKELIDLNEIYKWDKQGGMLGVCLPVATRDEIAKRVQKKMQDSVHIPYSCFNGSANPTQQVWDSVPNIAQNVIDNWIGGETDA